MTNNWQEIRQQVLERDIYTCQNCERMDKDLDIHHIIPKRLGGLDVLNNLISLCTKCHALLELRKPWVEKIIQLAQLKFVGKVSDMGDRKIIYIPKEFHKTAEKLQGKQVLIFVNDEIK